MNLKRTLCLFLAMALALGAGAASAQELKKLTVSEPVHLIGYLPLYVAIHEGYFAQEGLEVNVVQATGGAHVTAVVSGDAFAVIGGVDSNLRQRAALLRTLLTEREVLLLDEPFGALDALTRLQLQLGLTDVWQTFRKTILLVTHDVEEAIFLSDEILVLSRRPGRVRRQLTVPLPRPRTVDMLASPEVMGLKKELLELLLKEEGSANESNG